MHPTTAPHPAPLPLPTPSPWHGAVLIGTAETIRQTARLLEGAPGSPPLVGCIPVGERASDGFDVPAVGRLEDLAAIRATLGVTTAIVSLPAALGRTIADVRASIAEAGLIERFIPPVQDLLTLQPPFAVGLGGSPSTSRPLGAMSRIDEQSLIGRPAREIDASRLEGVVGQRRVLITGAGGSIGSELARLAARFGPAQLILMDRSENALFEIDRQIARRHASLPRRAILHDVVDHGHTLRLLLEVRPHVVLHAAAHKHVPLMEDHPALAVENNFFGTKSIADASIAAGVERFVMISTDKAVNPASVMGSTKRLAEIYVQHLARAAERMRGEAGVRTSRLSVVRFGNVLGSACSVLTIWATQIAEGGPVTVTDPAMTRYFMTIPEAAALVIQSASIDGRDGSEAAPIYVLDMGEPVRIVDLAGRFIRAQGFEPAMPEASEAGGTGEGSHLPSMPIVFTGARAGEKLHEELAYAVETLQPTSVPGVRVWNSPPTPPAAVDAMVTELDAVRHANGREPVVRALREHLRRLQREGGQPEQVVNGCANASHPPS